MKLRRLSIDDCDFMYEWMHDDDVINYLKKNFKNKSKKDCSEFIEVSNKEEAFKNNIHLAICNENNEYLGTISLKNIDYVNRNSEYAIVLRKMAMGKGYAQKATKEILNIAFKDLGLNKVYLNVISDNIRAIRFYEKCNFILEGKARSHICIQDKYYDLLWYSMLKKEYISIS